MRKYASTRLTQSEICLRTAKLINRFYDCIDDAFIYTPYLLLKNRLIAYVDNTALKNTVM
jgi:hypothetical protein